MGEMELEGLIVEWDDEERIRVIGMVDRVLFAVYTERGKRYRLISARNATKYEKEDYYGQFNY